MQLLDGDMFLICSDGLSDMVNDENIERLLSIDPSAAELVNKAKAVGAKDNTSVVVLTFGDVK